MEDTFGESADSLGGFDANGNYLASPKRTDAAVPSPIASPKTRSSLLDNIITPAAAAAASQQSASAGQNLLAALRQADAVASEGQSQV